MTSLPKMAQRTVHFVEPNGFFSLFNLSHKAKSKPRSDRFCHAAADEMIRVFDQSSALIRSSLSTTEFYSEK